MGYVGYDVSENAWKRHGEILDRLASEPRVSRALEIGGGANPALSLRSVEEWNLEYAVLDASPEELAKAPDGYEKVWGDITSPSLDLPGGYDLVISRMVAEHVRSGRTFHENVFDLLAAGGTAVHLFSTLYAPPYLANRLLPDTLSERVLGLLQPGREKEGRHGKFTAYYSWCRGPMSAQIKRLENLGYTVEEYVGFFGHAGYFKRLPLVERAHLRMASLLAKHPVPWLTSFAYVVLSRPEV